MWHPTPEQLAYLKSHYPSMTNGALAKALKVGVSTVESRAKIYGLKKAPNFIREVRRRGLMKKARNKLFDPRFDTRRDVDIDTFSQTKSGTYVAKIGNVTVHRTQILEAAP